MSRQAQTTYLKDYQPSAWLIETIDLVIDLQADHALVRSRLAVRRNAAVPAADLRLVGEDVALVALAVDDAVPPAGQWRLEGGELVIGGLGEAHVLEILTRIDPAGNTELSGLYKSDGIYCTQCEAEGFRRITYYLDRPDVMALFTTTIQADKASCPVLLSNGNLVASGELDGGRHWARWQDPFPKPCYLFAMVAGDLAHIEDSYTTGSGRNVILRIFSEAHNVHKCGFAMEALKRSMAWDERAYGREYDLDIFMIVAVDAFNMGAMENKGLNIFNAALVLAQPEATTDDEFNRIEGVVAHEYFHNWTGNRITCRDWFQITLKEGLTVFRDQEFSAEMGSRAVCRIADVQTLRSRQFPEDASPMAHAIQPVSYQKIDNFYTATVYEKGAEIIRMMHTLLGPEGYRKGTDTYFARHDGQAVTTEDFVAALEAGSGVDLRQFRRWYRQVGTPRLTVAESWDAARGELTLTFEQEVPGWSGEPLGPLHIPVAMGLLDGQGRELPVRRKGQAPQPGTCLIEVREASQSFVFEGLEARPHVSLLRGFSAPVRLTRELPEAELAFLLAHDTDAFSRWEAGQRLYLGSLKQTVENLREKRPAAVSTEMVDAWRATLLGADRDPSLVAQALALPTYAVLEQEYPLVPVDLLLQALELHRQTLARTCRDELAALYDRYQRELVSRPHSRSARDNGMRALRNHCLVLLTDTGDPEYAAQALRQFQNARCMTDTMGAMSALTHTTAPERETVLAEFLARWNQDPVVMNAWFSVQAISRREDTLERIGGLLEHPAFDLRNPNKVRSLLATFAAGNPLRFHEADGRAYRFFTDRLLEVDAINSHMGAALVRQLMNWKRHEPARSALMREQLQRVVAKEGLSPNAFEIASKSLEA